MNGNYAANKKNIFSFWIKQKSVATNLRDGFQRKTHSVMSASQPMLDIYLGVFGIFFNKIPARSYLISHQHRKQVISFSG